MKGFPNQIADLRKLSQGLQCIRQLIEQGANPRDDGVLGEALVRAGVLGTGHRPIPINQYLNEQRTKSLDRQSFRASARGLRELYRLLGLISDSDGPLLLTFEGEQAASFGDGPLRPSEIEFWRRVIRNFRHLGGDESESHPYQVLLHLIATNPGITRAKCALALEAKDDSPEELRRIAELSQLTEDRIRARIGVSQANWDNAKKVIPRFAEQLGDVVKTGQAYRLADAPGRASEDREASEGAGPRATNALRRPRTSRAVTPGTIGRAGLAERDEPPVPPTHDPVAAAAANRLRADRLRRHNLLLGEFASRLHDAGMALNEDPFDVFAVLGRVGILGEVKTLDGTQSDERERVRDALAQLLYYEAFVIPPVAGGAAIHKIACFERPITVEHQTWLNRSGIATIWKAGDRFEGDALAAGILGRYLEELR